jgi:hypothetical protein
MPTITIPPGLYTYAHAFVFAGWLPLVGEILHQYIHSF